MKKSPKLDPLAERPNLDFRKGVRGKFAGQLSAEVIVAIIEPGLQEHFPDSASVNKALRKLLAMDGTAREATGRKRENHSRAA